MHSPRRVRLDMLVMMMVIVATVGVLVSMVCLECECVSALSLPVLWLCDAFPLAHSCARFLTLIIIVIIASIMIVMFWS